jgi:hypothetical protein
MPDQKKKNNQKSRHPGELHRGENGCAPFLFPYARDQKAEPNECLNRQPQDTQKD